MFARLKSALTSPTNPSALLILGNFGSQIHVLHLLPENYDIERFSFTTSPSTTAFRRYGAKEQSRKQIGTVTIQVGDRESPQDFLNEVATRIYKHRKGSPRPSSPQPQRNEAEVAQLVQDILKPAALDAIREREERDYSVNKTETYPVFVVYITRSRPGKILGEPTSLG